ncbi:MULTISPECIES: hypothetical protein [unclassified Chamaesiphon]|uniref:hypothetical protein n=1 Tax=unclassified Chamaesiphon TaxID=2620921 RepID=UPI00286A1127|nr:MULTISPECIES: hypothetical protein [unclassified Chamaesiphon]
MKVNKNRQPVRSLEDRTGLAADEKHPAVKVREGMRQRVAAYSLTFGFLGI